MMKSAFRLRPWRHLLVLLLALSLTGCLGFGFWFERLDGLTIWRLDRMMDLTPEQEADLEPVAVALREWLRAEGIPEARRSLIEVRQRWLQGERVEAVQDFERRGELLVQQFLDASWPLLAPAIEQITPENAAAWDRYVEENAPDWFDEYRSRALKVAERVERLEDWFGDLSDAQVDLVEQNTSWREDEYDLRITNSRHWRSRFIELALAGDLITLEPLFRQPRQLQSPPYAAWREQQREEVLQLLARLLPTLSELQSAHAVERIDDWLAQLEEVSPVNPETAP